MSLLLLGTLLLVLADGEGRLHVDVDKEFLGAFVQAVLDLGKGLLVLLAAFKATIHGRQAVQLIKNRRRSR